MKIRSYRLTISAVLAVACLAAMIVGDCLAPQDADARSRRSRRTRVRKVTPTKINWLTSYAAGQKQAKASGKLMMIDVFADWCGPCHYLDDVTFKDRKVITQAQRFVPVKIDAEKGGGPAIAKKYKVDGYPTILFVDSSGKEVKRIDGAAEPEEFSKMLAAISSPRRKR